MIQSPAGAARLAPATAATVGRLVGSPVVSFEPRAGGYTRAITGRAVLADGRGLFVKTAAPDCPPDDPLVDDLRHELAVLRAVVTGPAAPHVPALVAAVGDPVPLLVVEDLAAARWPPPYPDDLAPLRAALELLAEVPPPAILPAIADEADADGSWVQVAADPTPIHALALAAPAWLEAALPGLVDAERRIRLQGDDLVHADLWYANLCFAARGPVIVDWGSAMRGNAVLDRATLAMDLVLFGRDPAELAVPDLGAWLAFLAGHLALEATRPPHELVAPDSTLRADQRADAVGLLPVLVDLLDLPPLPHTPGR